MLHKFLGFIFIKYYKLLNRLGVLPFDKSFGNARGDPIGRFYIEKFLKENKSYIKGLCLEFAGKSYKAFFPKIKKYEVISVEPGEGIKYVGDVHSSKTLPENRFNSIICTQVLEHLYNPQKALINLYNSLKPGGYIILTAPFFAIVHFDLGIGDYFRYTPEGFKNIINKTGLIIDKFDFGGNAMVTIGCILGMAQSDFSSWRSEEKDPIFPYNNLVLAHKPA